jgi:hypothetical protein
MGGTPGAHPLHIRRAPEVVAVLRFAQPTALTGRLAGTPTLRLGAVVLMAQIARIGKKKLLAVPALTSSVGFHWCALRSTPMMGKRGTAAPAKRHQAIRQTTQEDDGRRRRKERKE